MKTLTASALIVVSALALAQPSSVQRRTVVVGEGKYTPSVLRVVAGKPVEITFRGGKAVGCGAKVIFPSLKRSVTVSSGKSVLFKFTPASAGEVKFACSMDMYVGKVVVEKG